MALTPLTVPRRNYKTVTFQGPFTSIGTFTPPTPFLATPISTNCPYPQLSSGGTANDDRYYGAFLTADGTVIGKYNNTPDIDSISGKAISISSDKLTMHLRFGIAANYDFKSFASDANAYSLGPTATPADFSVAFAGGLDVIQNRDCLNDVYTIGLGMPALRDDGGGLDGLYAVMNNAGTFFNAFENDPDSNIYCDSFVTLNDGTWNYTFVVASPNSGTNGVYLSKWTPNAYNPAGTFTYTNYLVSLSDGADDAIFQAGNDYAGFAGNRYIHANNENFVYIFDDGASPIVAQTVFIFAADLSWYDRLDIVIDSNAITFGTYFQDIDGEHYFLGKSSGSLVYEIGGIVTDNIVPFGGGAPGNPLKLSEVILLPCYAGNLPPIIQKGI